MAVDELSTPYHLAPAYFDDVAPHLLMYYVCSSYCAFGLVLVSPTRARRSLPAPRWVSLRSTAW
jgi:hypothetical protein